MHSSMSVEIMLNANITLRWIIASSSYTKN